MNEQYSNINFDTWVQDPDVEKIIDNIARKVYLSFRTGVISLPFYTFGEPLSKNKEDVIHDIKSEIILFILENSGDLALRIMAAGKSAAQYLKASFINHCKDSSRTKSSNTFKYFYRRAAAVLRGSKDFHTVVRQTGIISFSSGTCPRPVPPLTKEDMALIPFPARSAELNFDSINRKNKILELAGFFLDHLSKQQNNIPVQVDLRDFIFWTGLHVDITDHKNDAVEYTDDTAAYQDSSENDLSLSGHKYRPDRLYENVYFDSAMVKIWANNFSAGLSQKEKLLFYLRHGKNLSLKKISHKTDYKSPSGVKQKLDRLNQKLCFFLRDLPWMSPDQNGRFNEEAFSLFLDDLIKALKNSIQKP